MITAVTPFSPEFLPVFPDGYAGKRAIYFDIETTGLSAQTSYVYLIGCACEDENGFALTQWLCTEPAEEKELLRLFFEKAKEFDLLLHYNGTGFDLPFLEKKAVRHHLTSPLSLMESLDLYKTARTMKSWLPLPDLKLKTMERFFGFSRTEPFSGVDLIEVYAQFLGLHHLNTLTNNKKQKEELALTQVLMLHNAEDVKNLPSLTVLFFLRHLSSFLTEHTLLPVPAASARATLSTSFPTGGPAADSLSPNTPVADSTGQLSVSYCLPFALPKDFSLSLPWGASAIRLFFSAEHGTVSFLLPVFHGTLKHFYPNPSDYYYLPLEDCAMHKSVASFVEKEYRQKATAATCYTKQTGAFLPLFIRPAKNTKGTVKNATAPDGAMSLSATDSVTAEHKKEASKGASASLPCFLSDYKSKFGYTPLTAELLGNPALLTNLCRQLLVY